MVFGFCLINPISVELKVVGFDHFKISEFDGLKKSKKKIYKLWQRKRNSLLKERK